MQRATARIRRQQLHQCGCLGLGWCGSRGGLELQDALTQRLESHESLFDTGESLRQGRFQQDADRRAWVLTRAGKECLDLFKGQSEGSQALDHLHAPQRFFAKQAIIALAAAPRAEESEALV